MELPEFPESPMLQYTGASSARALQSFGTLSDPAISCVLCVTVPEVSYVSDDLTIWQEPIAFRSARRQTIQGGVP